MFLNIRFFFLVLAILSCLITHSSAQDLGLESVAPVAGFSYITEQEMPGVLGGVTFNMGELSRGVELYPGFIYGYGKKEGNSRSAFQFSLDAKYFFSPTSAYYAGAGFSVNHITWEHKDGEIKPGGTAFFGGEYFAGRKIWFVQLKFDYVQNEASLSVSTGIFFNLYRF